MALYNAFLYGNTYIFYADFVSLWTDRYNQSVQIAGLNYISIAISSGLATAIYTVTIDRIYRAMSKRNGGQGKPEFRIPVMVPGTLLLGVGLFWYGWSAKAILHWIMPNIGCALFVAGATVCTSSVNAYIVDTYGQLGYGWAATVLGLIALGIGLPAVGLLWQFGSYLRQKSSYSNGEKVTEH
ncbi:MFS multidrug transporter [Colletotrichum tofieldiae]|nr:MFS multidrug transporter [Colletotrichum tofieldiae]